MIIDAIKHSNVLRIDSGRKIKNVLGGTGCNSGDIIRVLNVNGVKYRVWLSAAAFVWFCYKTVKKFIRDSCMNCLTL